MEIRNPQKIFFTAGLGDLLKEFDVPFAEVKPDLAVIGRTIGYREIDPPPQFKKKIRLLLKVAEEKVHIKAGYRVLNSQKFLLKQGSIIYGEIIFNIGEIIASQLQGSQTIVLFLSTAGSSITEWSNSLFQEGDFLSGYIVDSIGSEIAESAAAWIAKKLESTLKHLKLKSTHRFSPGYCGWNVSEQHKLFSLLPVNFCKVEITESALMLPLKSASGIIGIGREVRKSDYSCEICDRNDCYRRPNNNI